MMIDLIAMAKQMTDATLNPILQLLYQIMIHALLQVEKQAHTVKVAHQDERSPKLPTASPARSKKDKKHIRDLRSDSKQRESRSPSPQEDDRKRTKASSYKKLEDRSTAADKKQTKSPESKYISYGSFGIIQLNFNIVSVIIGEMNNGRDRINAPPQYFSKISLNFHLAKVTFLKKFLISVCTKSYSFLNLNILYHFDKHNIIDWSDHNNLSKTSRSSSLFS